MKSRAFFKAAMTVVAGCGALLANAETDVASTVEIVDSVEISADTNVVVEAGKTLKFEYVYGENSVTITKSGAGRLSIATSSHKNLSVNIAEGTFASVRPAAIPMTGEFKPVLRVDASVTNTFTFAKANGTNFISKIVDADGNNERWLHAQYNHNDPYLADEKLNGMHLIDFGTYYDEKDPRFAGGYGGCFWVNKIGNKDGFPLREYFCVWKDRDDVYDVEIPEGGTDFYGPSIFGNNANYFLRGKGTPSQGFPLVATGMHDVYKKNLFLDGNKVAYTYRPSRGFHLLRNRADESGKRADGSTIEAAYWTLLGWNNPKGGGFLLAEIVAYSNQLSEASALRVEAQLQAKWLGTKLNTVTVQNAATLDVGEFKFNINTLDIAGEANISGETNLCFDVLTRTSSNVVASGVYVVDGSSQPLVPDMSFDGDARISVTGESRVEKVSSATGEFKKLGEGELRIADPVVSNITVTAGTLNVSPLYVRSAEYHLDATRRDTIDWTFDDGKKLISAWHDMEDPSRKFVKTNYRKPGYDQTRFVRPPYITENAVGDMPMVDFGTFANYNYPDGWGGCLDATPAIGGSHDFFAVWMDYPEVKNYAYGGDGKPFIGPCIFGMQYHWNRGSGGNGESFAIHNTGCPINMWNPPADGLVIVDNVIVHGQSDRIGDGVHVLVQRTHTNDGKQGAPLEQIGGSYQALACNSDGIRTNGTYGGLLIGEVLVFKDYLSDRMRMRISGALCSKWRGDTNEWAYGSLKIEPGATLKHQYADLVPDWLELAGKISAVSVKPNILKVIGTTAEIDGKLKLEEGGSIVVTGDPENGFGAVKAASVYAGGKGSITLGVENPSAYIGEEYRIVESANVAATSDFCWRAPALQGSGTRAVLKAKSDGVYLVFEGSGMTVTIR